MPKFGTRSPIFIFGFRLCVQPCRLTQRRRTLPLFRAKNLPPLVCQRSCARPMIFRNIGMESRNVAQAKFSTNQVNAIVQWLPFWISLSLVPSVVIAAMLGGWALILPPLVGWVGFTLLDFAVGTSQASNDPETPPSKLRMYRLVTLIWFPIQFVLVFGLIACRACGPSKHA